MAFTTTDLSCSIAAASLQPGPHRSRFSSALTIDFCHAAQAAAAGLPALLQQASTVADAHADALEHALSAAGVSQEHQSAKMLIC